LATVNPLVAAGTETEYLQLKNFWISRQATFVSVDGRDVSLLVAAATETTRAEDVFAACVAAHLMDTEVSIHYLAGKRKVIVWGLPAIWELCIRAAKLRRETGDDKNEGGRAPPDP
jgi:hypothetical protein